MRSLQGGLKYAMFMIQDPFGSTTGGIMKHGVYYPFTIVDGYPYFRRAELLLLDKPRQIYLVFKNSKQYVGIETDLEKEVPEILTLLNICKNNLGITPQDIEFKLNCRIDFDEKHQIPKRLEKAPVKFRGMITSIYTGFWDHTPMKSEYNNVLLDRGNWYYIPTIRSVLRDEHLKAVQRKVYSTEDVRHIW